MKFYVSIGETESGDKVTPVVWVNYEPTNDEVSQHFEIAYPEEHEDGLRIRHVTKLAVGKV